MKFTVDYDRTLADVLAHAGVAWHGGARLGVFGAGRHDLEGTLLRFDEDVATPAVLARMAESGLRPATFFELVSAADSDVSLGRSVVVALGSCDVNNAAGSASPAIATAGGERQIVLTGFLGAWPAGTEFLAIPSDASAGLGTVPHNHLLPIEKKRAPKLVFPQPPCSFTQVVMCDGTASVRDAVKPAKLRNVADAAYDEAQFPPEGPARAVEVVALTFNRQLQSRDVRAELAARGLRPATIRELIALVTVLPDSIETRSIWALEGSKPSGAYKAGTRTLGVHVGIGSGIASETFGRWEAWAWFAAVRESSAKASAAVKSTNATAPKKVAPKKAAPKKAKPPAKKPKR